MKTREDVLKLIANQLDFLNNKWEGARTEFTPEELSNADVILTTLEHAGLITNINIDKCHLHEFFPGTLKCGKCGLQVSAP